MKTREQITEALEGVKLLGLWGLTAKEHRALSLCVQAYAPTDVAGYTERLTSEQKGTFGSLVKKGLIYDAYAGWGHEDPDHQEGNWLITDEVIEALGLPEYRP